MKPRRGCVNKADIFVTYVENFVEKKIEKNDLTIKVNKI